MGQSAHGCDGSRLLPTSHGSGAYEERGVFAVEAARLPEATRLVPECFPLPRKIAIAGWDAENEGVIFFENVWCDGRVVRFWGSIHLAEDFLGEGFGDSGKKRILVMVVLEMGEESPLARDPVEGFLLVNVNLAPGRFDAFLLSFGQRFDVAVHRVLHSTVRKVTQETRGCRFIRRLTKTIATLGAIAKEV